MVRNCHCSVSRILLVLMCLLSSVPFPLLSCFLYIVAFSRPLSHAAAVINGQELSLFGFPHPPRPDVSLIFCSLSFTFLLPLYRCILSSPLTRRCSDQWSGTVTVRFPASSSS